MHDASVMLTNCLTAHPRRQSEGSSAQPQHRYHTETFNHHVLVTNHQLLCVYSTDVAESAVAVHV